MRDILKEQHSQGNAMLPSETIVRHRSTAPKKKLQRFPAKRVAFALNNPRQITIEQAGHELVLATTILQGLLDRRRSQAESNSGTLRAN